MARRVRKDPAYVALVAALLCVLGLAVHAADWPEFRGPTGQGHSPETGLPLAWGEAKNISWKVRVNGSGWSSPVVADGRIYVTSMEAMYAIGKRLPRQDGAPSAPAAAAP